MLLFCKKFHVRRSPLTKVSGEDRPLVLDLRLNCGSVFSQPLPSPFCFSLPLRCFFFDKVVTIPVATLRSYTFTAG